MNSVVNSMKEKIINECTKYGYKLDKIENDFMYFVNENQIEELQLFLVNIDYDLETVSMSLIVDLGSWNEATDSDLLDEEDIIKNIQNWLSEENIKEVEKWLK